jgi:hypothetical protein
MIEESVCAAGIMRRVAVDASPAARRDVRGMLDVVEVVIVAFQEPVSSLYCRDAQVQAEED